MSAVAILGTVGIVIKKNNENPYNSKNVIFINEQLDDYSKKMDDFLVNDFNHFEGIVYNLSSGNYNGCNKDDISDLNKYMDIILTCNFNDYSHKTYGEREKSGFVINFENYFPVGSVEQELVGLFSNHYEKIIRDTYRYVNPDVDKIVRQCSDDFHNNEFKISQLSPFARYIIYKLIRPIISENYYTYYPYYRKENTLPKIDAEINKCMDYMTKQCPFVAGHK